MGWKERNRPAVDRYRKRAYCVWTERYFWLEVGGWRGWKHNHGRSIRRFHQHRTLLEFDREFSRAKRSVRRMPKHYDDVVIQYERSWKRHRKHRWRQKTA